MGYEARQEAMNDFIADRIHEAMPDNYTLDEDIPEVIEQGSFDVAVMQRAAAIMTERGFAHYPGLLRAIAEELKENEA